MESTESNLQLVVLPRSGRGGVALHRIACAARLRRATGRVCRTVGLGFLLNKFQLIDDDGPHWRERRMHNNWNGQLAQFV